MKIQAKWLALALLGGLVLSNGMALAADIAASPPAGHSGTAVPAAPSIPVPSIKADELKQAMKSASPPVVIDVREPDERVNGVIAGDKNIPLGELDKHYSELPKDKPIVFYCRSGRRSANAVTMLREAGFTNVKTLLEGINGWGGSSAAK